MGLKRYYEARRIIEDFLRKDLVGPVEEKEIIVNEYPSQYYSMGILFPQRTEIDKLEQVSALSITVKEEADSHDNTDGDSFEDVDDGVSLSNMYNPSSLAVSTTIKQGIDTIRVHIKYGRYELLSKEEISEYCTGRDVTGEDKDANQADGADDKLGAGTDEELPVNRKRKKVIKQAWKRIPCYSTLTVNPDSKVKFLDVENGLQIHVYVQKEFEDGSRTITVAAVNTNGGNASQRINELNSFFQVELEITDCDEKSPLFIPKRMNIDISEDPELNNLNMLYSHVKNYAVGHGCSVECEADENGCFKICSQILPAYEVKQMKPSVRMDRRILQMNFLASGTKQEIRKGLMELVSSYNAWIEEQKKDAAKLEPRFYDAAKNNIDLCIETSERIKQGIEMLEDDLVFRAFQLANRGMYNQRVSYLKRANEKIIPEKITWYPFQLAFILQEIPSTVIPEDKYRDIVDLLWFPTGGGKTEAYLGISAFVIFYRRLSKGENSGGVTIIMRYTLRLLTIQQFERAAAMICACESLRKKENLGGEEISIGLFVGGGLTPNRIDKAEENLLKIKQSGIKSVREGNPCQVLKCPVCGTAIVPNNYKFQQGHMKIMCPNELCEYSGGLPVYLVDEDIYHFRPTLIISTVDKFARMTWEPRIARVFGVGCNCLPPELIIQDELHLISGPLGTITGLYETAIDCFCHYKDTGPKIIASTATIRNAREQIIALYGRECRQFPPQGINIRDSYFAEEALEYEKPTRKYMGVLSPNKTATTILIRVYACLQFASRYLKDLGFEDEVIDNFWTITGYFNSLRELGGAVIQVYDDVQDRYAFLYNKKFTGLKPEFTSREEQDELEELTSRKNQSEITKALEDLGQTYGSGRAFDYVLASNMISVGVDIGRLGVMAITGQPKSNSEYIQASSRIGRKNPGLVVTVYNCSRSRDRSHYEQFISYHSAMYKYVEATSLTPFSARARERALHAVYISMCRYLIDELRKKSDAANFNSGDKRLEHIEKFILERAEKIVNDKDELAEVMADIEKIKTIWEKSTMHDNLAYDRYCSTPVIPLLGDASGDTGIFPTLNSMRNVDALSNIYLEED